MKILQFVPPSSGHLGVSVSRVPKLQKLISGSFLTGGGGVARLSTGGVRDCRQGGGGVRAIATHPGPTTDGGGGGVLLAWSDFREIVHDLLASGRRC